MAPSTSFALGSGKTLTISTGSVITNTNNQFIINIGVAATTVNNGTLAVNYVPEGTPLSAAIATTGGTASSMITNNGTASATTAGNGNTAAGVYYKGAGAATVTTMARYRPPEIRSPAPGATPTPLISRARQATNATGATVTGRLSGQRDGSATGMIMPSFSHCRKKVELGR